MYVRPALGDLAAGKLDAELLESFYARLQRCRDLCDGRRRARVMSADRSVAAPSERFTTSSAPHWSSRSMASPRHEPGGTGDRAVGQPN
jgi:hypothetical protein